MAKKCEQQEKEILQPKVFNDPIHGSIELHPLLVKIIDTPQFQRLRNIKQLGVVCYVYPGACHTRFEHSIGVAHLAGEFAYSLKMKHKMTDEELSDKDILCVQIAGLCRNIGYGPFLNPFKVFLHEPPLKHEELSEKMFDHMVKENNLEPLMEEYGLGKTDLMFIKEMINPKNENEGRPKEKFFLYDIVSNKTNFIDVDTFDSLSRDCYHLGIQNTFESHRFLKFARVCEVEDEKHITIRDKEVECLYDLFQTRYRLNKHAYQHRVTKAIEIMLKDAFSQAGALPIGDTKKLSVAVQDMAVYTKLTDRVFDQILYHNLTGKKLEKAKTIVQRIVSRDFYECLGEVDISEEKEKKDETITKYIGELTVMLEKLLTPEDFEIVVINIEYGIKERDPIENMYFYRKTDPDKAIEKSKVTKFFQDYSCETGIRVYLKKTHQKSLKEMVKEQFQQWHNKVLKEETQPNFGPVVSNKDADDVDKQ